MGAKVDSSVILYFVISTIDRKQRQKELRSQVTLPVLRRSSRSGLTLLRSALLSTCSPPIFWTSEQCWPWLGHFNSSAARTWAPEIIVG